MGENKKLTGLKKIQKDVDDIIQSTNEHINLLGEKTEVIYGRILELQNKFDEIRNVPSEEEIKIHELKKVRFEWKSQVDKIEQDYNIAAGKIRSKAGVATSAGVAVAALGPTTAMGIATTFGVASTGTAISTLSGAAATKAALAWLGGGALTAGGGGIAAGNALLALSGPVGWTIAVVSVLSSGLLLWKRKSDKDKLEEIFSLIGKRDLNSYKLAIIELNERIDRIEKEAEVLMYAIQEIEMFGKDYNTMTELQQYKLGAYVNLMNLSTQLLVNPIFGLQPKVAEQDVNEYISRNNDTVVEEKIRTLILTLSNILFGIELDDKERELLWKSFRGNKDFLASMNVTKGEFSLEIMNTTVSLLKSLNRAN